ncbi:MAG: hypothetical protein HY368_02775 [Candidatus Aenigmarchaeota archaeon]|nr:hypothetical protein [Candidatus Aenigmarchaeota archaeon]
MNELPQCCGKEMSVKMETVRFMEIECQTCRDVVYLKKESKVRPEMLDD